MITKEQALTAREFHVTTAGYCIEHVGPRGGVTIKQEVWRRNGATQTWVTRPDDFRIPVKHGLRHYGQIHENNADGFHTAEDCPLNS